MLKALLVMLDFKSQVWSIDGNVIKYTILTRISNSIILVELLLGGVVLGLLHCLVKQVPSLVSRLGEGAVDGALVLLEQRQDNAKSSK